MKVVDKGNMIVIYLSDKEAKYKEEIKGELEHIRKFIDVLVKHGLD